MSSDKIRIDTDKLDEISQQFNRLSGSLNTIQSSIAQAISTAQQVVPEQPAVIRNLSTLKNRVNTSGEYARKVSVAVRDASARWAEAEQKISGQKLDAGEAPNGGDGSSDGSGGAGGGATGKSGWSYVLDGLFKAVGGAGAIGKIVSAIWSGASKNTTADWLKALADCGGGVANIIKEGAKGVDANWAKALFGLGEYTKTFGENMSNPVSWVVNLVKSGIDNWSYAQEGNVIRFVTETGSEAATNVLLGAGGMALAAAVLPAGAPVIAVAAAGAVAVWGVNTIVKSLTGNDIAGHVGNFVGEATDWAVEKGGEAVEWVADKGKQLLDTGAQVVSDAKDAVCNFFSAVFA